MKLLRKLFSKKDHTEKKIEKNNQDLKKRNINRGVGTAIGVGLGAYTGKVTGDIAKGVVEKGVYNKAAKEALGAFINSAEKVARKASRGGELTEREVEFLQAAQQQIKKPAKEIAEETVSMVRRNKTVRGAAEKAGKRAKLGIGLAIGGTLAARTIAKAVKDAKADKKKTEEKNNDLKKKSKKFSKFGEVSKRAAKKGIIAGKKFVRDFDRYDYDNLKSSYDALTNTPGDNKNESKLETLKKKVFSGREKVSKELLKEAKKSGVIQKDSNGNWRIISIQAGEFWDAKYETREKAEAALAAYHANRH